VLSVIQYTLSLQYLHVVLSLSTAVRSTVLTTSAEDSVLIINESTTTNKPITFNGLVDLYLARILIDCGATTNYISESFAKKYGIYIEASTNTTNTKLADGTTLNVKHTAPDLQVHIQDYIDEINADVIPLTHYDMVLGISWLEKYKASVHHSSRVITLEYEGNTIILQPDITPNANSTSEDQMQLIKDDQHLKAEEDTYEIVHAMPTAAQAPAQIQLSNIIKTLFFIAVIIILATIYAWYSTANQIVQASGQYSHSLVSPLAEYQQQSQFSILSFLFRSTRNFNNPIGIICILLYMYTYNYQQHTPPIYSSTTEKLLDRYVISPVQDSEYEHTLPKSKKGRPR
jgi:predicted aspartyl protease